MDIDAQKSEIINWISRLRDQKIIGEVLLLKKRSESENQPVEKDKMREFGSGRHIFTNIAEDFNEPLDDFKEYMPE